MAKRAATEDFAKEVIVACGGEEVLAARGSLGEAEGIAFETGISAAKAGCGMELKRCVKPKSR